MSKSLALSRYSESLVSKSSLGGYPVIHKCCLPVGLRFQVANCCHDNMLRSKGCWRRGGGGPGVVYAAGWPCSLNAVCSVVVYLGRRV